MSATRTEGCDRPLQTANAHLAVGRGLASSLAAMSFAILLAGCGSAIGNANAGPNPGGGFYGAPNLNVGRVNP